MAISCVLQVACSDYSDICEGIITFKLDKVSDQPLHELVKSAVREYVEIHKDLKKKNKYDFLKTIGMTREFEEFCEARGLKDFSFTPHDLATTLFVEEL